MNLPISVKAGGDITAVCAGLATFFEYLPGIMGTLASLAALIWIGIQAYYFIKEKKK